MKLLLSSSLAFFVLSAIGESSAAVFGAFAFFFGSELWTGRKKAAFEDSHNRRDV